MLRLNLLLILAFGCTAQSVFRAQNVTPASGGTPIAVVAHTCASSSDTNAVTTSAINTTGATLIVVFLADYAIMTASVITDSKSNTWVARTRYGPGSSLSGSKLLYATGTPTVGSGHTFTATGSTNYPSICVIAFSGTAATSPYDVENGAFTTVATTLQPGSASPSQNNEVLVVGTAMQTFGTTASINSSFTISDQTPGSLGFAWAAAMAYKIQTTKGAENPTWAYSGSVDASTGIATFKAP